MDRSLESWRTSGCYRADLVLPQDAAPGVWYALLRIRQPKTRGRAARHQAVRIDPGDVAALLAAIFGSLSPSSMLWPSSPATFRRRSKVLDSPVSAWPRPEEGLTQYALFSCLSQAWWSHALAAGHRRCGVCATQRKMDFFWSLGNLSARSCCCYV